MKTNKKMENKFILVGTLGGKFMTVRIDLIKYVINTGDHKYKSEIYITDQLVESLKSTDTPEEIYAKIKEAEK